MKQLVTLHPAPQSAQLLECTFIGAEADEHGNATAKDGRVSLSPRYLARLNVRFTRKSDTDALARVLSARVDDLKGTR
jgi:hypothetical protein